MHGEGEEAKGWEGGSRAAARPSKSASTHLQSDEDERPEEDGAASENEHDFGAVLLRVLARLAVGLDINDILGRRLLHDDARLRDSHRHNRLGHALGHYGRRHNRGGLRAIRGVSVRPLPLDGHGRSHHGLRHHRCSHHGCRHHCERSWAEEICDECAGVIGREWL